MKIYDMVEGKWLKDEEKKKEKEQEIKDYENFGIDTRLITYDEEKAWIRRERDYIKIKEKVILTK